MNVDQFPARGVDARRAPDALRPFADLAAVAAVEAAGIDNFAPEKSIYELLARSAERQPQRRAIWHFASGEPGAAETQLTYETFVRRVVGAANFFQHLGVGREDVIGYLLPSVPELHELVWGGETAGIVCTVNHFLEPELIAAMLERVQACVLVVPGPDENAEIWNKAERVRERLPRLRAIVRVGGRPGDSGIDYRREAAGFASDRPSMAVPRGDHLAAYFHTGGTTGTPKLAPQTHRSQVIAVRSAAYAFGLRPDDVVLNGLPHFHIGGLYAGGVVPFAAGATVVQLGARGFRDQTVVTNFWRLAEATGATVPIAIPTVISALLEQDHRVCDTRRLRFVISGASGLSPGLRAAFQSRTGVRINEAYGLTEATFVASVNPWAGVAKAGSVGVRLPFVEVGTLPSEAGGAWQVLAVRGPTVFPGYLGMEADAQPFRDGWLVTGDLGRIDADGHIFLTGRSKDVIKRGGHAIDPLLIEEVLAAHPAVALCAAIGQPEPRLGEVPVAYVQLRPEAAVSESDLLDLARRELHERAAVPKAIRIREQLPKTSIGKIDKVELRRDAARTALHGALADLSSRDAEAGVQIEFHGEVAIVRISSSDSATCAWVRQRLRDFTIPIELVEGSR